jgi:hypothetical protein
MWRPGSAPSQHASRMDPARRHWQSYYGMNLKASRAGGGRTCAASSAVFSLAGLFKLARCRVQPP